MKKSSWSMVVAGCLATLTCLPAAAQFQRPEDAVKYRQSALAVMGAHFSRIGAMAQGRVPFDAAAASANAEIVSTMARLPFVAFVDGSQGGKAKAEIWSDRAGFNTAATRMQEEVTKLAAAARSGNADQLRAAFGATAGTCKGCHDNYRSQ